MFREFYLKPGFPKIVYDTIQKINDRYFHVFAMKENDTLQQRRVVAITSIMGNEIKVQYDFLSRTKDSIEDSYISNSIELLKYIRVTR
jgi:hypothetical protein